MLRFEKTGETGVCVQVSYQSDQSVIGFRAFERKRVL